MANGIPVDLTISLSESEFYLGGKPKRICMEIYILANSHLLVTLDMHIKV